MTVVTNPPQSEERECGDCQGELRYMNAFDMRGVPTERYVCLHCGATEYHSVIELTRDKTNND